ncbi:MAG: tetratricopeptide repeat protein [Gemmatimonadales bacterium]
MKRWRLAAILAILGLGATRSAAAQALARFEAAVAEGDAAWKSGRFPDAKAAYQAALAIDSMGSSRAVYRLAVLRSWDGDLTRAIPLFQRYTVLEPRDEEGRIALAKAFAWNGETALSVAVYDSILGRDRTYRDAALGAALALAWAGRFEEAVARYDRWLAENARDVEAELARARTLAWSGKLGRAEATYAEIAARGERLEADKGVALVAAWRGDLLRSESLWRRVTERAPKDAEAWVGLAQVLRWSGRPEDARDALQRALAADPENTDAAEQLRWVRADLAPAVDPSVTASWDSDENRSAVVALGATVRPVRRVRLTIAGSRREASLAAASGTSTAGRLVLRTALGRRVTVVGDVGTTRMHASDGAAGTDRTVTTGGGSVTLRVAPRLAVGANVRRSAFDETAALLLSGIDVRSAGLEGEWEPFGRVALAGGVERASLRGGSGPNERRAAFGALRWRVRRQVTLSLAGRGFRYDEQRRDGYFAPARYELAEVGGRWAPGRDLGWAASVEVAAGAQRVTFSGPPATRATQRAGMSLAFRPAPGNEIGLQYSFSNVAGTAAEGTIYRGQSLSLTARITF